MKHIRYATEKDSEVLISMDSHLTKDVLDKKVSDHEILVLVYENRLIGTLRFSMFWDEHPFMNLLYVSEAFRGKGFGRDLTFFWETEMKNRRHQFVMTSTQSDEVAQHFYRKLGYKDIGSFAFPGEWLELIMIKVI